MYLAMTERVTGFRSDWLLGVRYGEQLSESYVGNQQVACQYEAI